MSSKSAASRPARDRQSPSFPFRLTPLAAIVAGMAFLSAGSPAHAADDRTVAELQAEIARLKLALEKSQQELGAKAAAQAAPIPEATDPAAKPPTDEPQALDTVVVRSRNRIERLQDVPLSVSVVTGKELDRLGAHDIDAITKRAANVSWNQGNQRTSSLSIRGIGKQGQTEAQDPSVGLIVDGVNYAYNALSSSFDFTDVDAVEVTRGPQGTLLGKNTSLGVINIQTRRPSFTPSADYSLTFGQRDRFKGTLAGGGAIIDNLLAWRGAFVVDRGAGDIVNSYDRDRSYANTDRVSGRAKFLFTPSEDFSALVSFNLTPRAGEYTNGRTINTPTPLQYSNGTATDLKSDASTRLARAYFTNSGYSYQNDYLYGSRDGTSVNNDGARPLITGSRGTSVELNWNVGEHTLTSITAYQDYHFNAVNDEGTPFDINRNSGGFWNDYQQVSQELRLSSKAGGLVDYQTGLYYIDVQNQSNYQKSWGNDAGAWFASSAQYDTLYKNDTTGQGANLLRDSLANLKMYYNSPTGTQSIRNKSAAIFGQANWHLSDELTLTTGLRLTQENRDNTGSSVILDNGNGALLNPSVINGVTLGGFDSVFNAAHTGSTYNTYLSADGTTVVAKGTAGAIATDTIYVSNGQKVTVGTNIAGASTTPGASTITAVNVGTTALTTAPGAYTAAKAAADASAQHYFNVADWNALSAAQKKAIAYAQAIRKSQIGVLFNTTRAKAFQAIQPAFVFSPSYKVNENLTTYFSLQYGEKAGISQFVNGISAPVNAEKSTSFELGLKSALFNKTLILNADLFLTNIKDYQQSVRVVDSYSTSIDPDGKLVYSSTTGNAPKVQAKGLEIDGVYAGIPRTTIRFSGAYNDARYKSFPNAAQPVENGWKDADPYRDLTGQTLPGASKISFNVGAEYRQPAFGNQEIHLGFNTAYTSKYNSDNALSEYAWIKAKYITDLAIGIGRQDKSYDLSLLVKNAFDDSTPLTRSWNSYTPATPRWYGIVFTGKL